MPKKLDVAKEFTPTPIGRYRADGSRSGEVFREDILRPALRAAAQTGEVLEIDFSGMVGFNPSFLEEGFAGLIRNPDPSTGKKMTAKEIHEKIIFGSKVNYHKPYIEKLKKYILDEEARQNSACERQ